MNPGVQGRPDQSDTDLCAQPSPKPLVKELSWSNDNGTRATEIDLKCVYPLADSPLLDQGRLAPPERAILGSIGDLSSRESISLRPWGRWAKPCHWRCRLCTERLGFLLVGQVLAALPAIHGEDQQLGIGTLTVSPPPGVKLGELRRALEELAEERQTHAIWGIQIAHKGRVFAYLLATTNDPKELERRARAKVFGDSRSARFNRVRGSGGCWLPPDQVFAFNVGRVIRWLVRRGPLPPTLRPGYRFGASGQFAALLSNALGILRHEAPCDDRDQQAGTKQAGEISPDTLGTPLRACLWCGLSVSGKGWRHPHCSTRVWRARCALRPDLSPEDYDGFLFRADAITKQGTPEPEATRLAFLEFAGADATLPRAFLETITLPREITPPGRREPVATRMQRAGQRTP